ncbi:hypothetical protein HOLleu_20492 [Holothuria leucospilota]|uniref:Uncharacterized protein n=1 Tax=Holothuria leucospilota TaxID=206669 RepID=A0A9Q1H815_HOLLE|nr:hypothetical protein HOLleu_20492 [Holothuria leucospilota]
MSNRKRVSCLALWTCDGVVNFGRKLTHCKQLSLCDKSTGETTKFFMRRKGGSPIFSPERQGDILHFYNSTMWVFKEAIHFLTLNFPEGAFGHETFVWSPSPQSPSVLTHWMKEEDTVK